METAKWILLSLLGLFGAYVLVRVLSRAVFMSWFEVSTEEKTKKTKMEEKEL